MTATIVIPARNAAPTIQRAIRSARTQGPYPILLVDHGSADETVRLAEAAGAGWLQVIRLAEHRTLGAVRQTALDAVETPCIVWLDADDELLPGRVDCLLAAMEAGADVASDGMELVDESGARQVLAVPRFLMEAGGPVRLFERNYLPGPGVIGVRTAHARAIGFDPALHGAEDVDFLLRSIASGARIRLIDSVGYRAYSSPDSLSRQLGGQRAMYRACLLKHAYETIQGLYAAAGVRRRVMLWGLASLATFRQEYARALEYVQRAARLVNRPEEVLEPQGPEPVPEGWRADFHQGTLLLLLGDAASASRLLDAAERRLPSAEGANNLGVAHAQLGDRAGARALFSRALERFPAYLDARLNLEEGSGRITTHALRRLPARLDYSPRAAR